MTKSKRILSVILSVCILLSCVSVSFGSLAFADEAPAATQEYKISTYATTADVTADGIGVIATNAGQTSATTSTVGYSLTSTDPYANGTKVIKLGQDACVTGVFTFPHKQNAELYKPTKIAGTTRFMKDIGSSKSGTTFWTGKTTTVTQNADTGDTVTKDVYDGLSVNLRYDGNADNGYLPKIDGYGQQLVVTTTVTTEGEKTVTYKLTDPAAIGFKNFMNSAAMAANIYPNNTEQQNAWLELAKVTDTSTLTKDKFFIPFEYYYENSTPYLKMTLSITSDGEQYTVKVPLTESRTKNGFMAIGICGPQYGQGVYMVLGDVTVTYDISPYYAAQNQVVANEFTTYLNDNSTFSYKYTKADKTKIAEILTRYDALSADVTKLLSEEVTTKIADLRNVNSKMESTTDLFYDFENTGAVADFEVKSKINIEGDNLQDTLTETNTYSADAVKNSPEGTEAFWGVHTDTATNKSLWLRKSFSPNNMDPINTNANNYPSVRYALKDSVIAANKRVKKVSFKYYMGSGNCWDSYKLFGGIVLGETSEYSYNVYGISNNGNPTSKKRSSVTGKYEDNPGSYIQLDSITGNGTDSDPGYDNIPNTNGGTETTRRLMPFGTSEWIWWGDGSYRGFQTAAQWLNVTVEWNAEKGHYVMSVNGTHKGTDKATHETTRYYNLTAATEMVSNISFTTMNTTNRGIDDLAITLADYQCTHDWSEWETTTPVTCTTDGEKARTCSLCGEDETETITHQGHKYSDTVVPPTCTEQGYTKHECSVCGDDYTDTYTDAKHTPKTEWTVITAPSVGADGESKLYCSVCDEVLDTKVTKFTGFHTDSGKTYYYEEGVMVTGWKTIETKQYFFKENGQMMKDCQALVDGETYIFGTDGAVVGTPTLSIIDDKCYKEGKYQVKGWQTVNGEQYYFGGEDGKMLKDQITIIWDSVYKFDENGKLVTDTLTITGKKCYNAEGEEQTGWQTVYGEQFYFRENGAEVGYMVYGARALINGELYVFEDNGTLVENPKNQIIDEKCYLHGKYQVKGWQTVDGDKYYFGGEDGTMLKNQTTMIYEDVCKFDESGKLVTDTLMIKGRKCYDAEGNMKTGWQTVYGEQYYFRASGTYAGYMITGKAWIGGKGYTFNSNGVLVQ